MAYQNFFAAKLYTDIGAGDTTITLDTAPTATSGRMVLEARNPTQREVIKYTGVSGNQLTGVTRGQGGTTAKSHLKNALVEMNLTSEDIQDLYDAFASFAATNNDWRTLVPTVSSVTYLGNRSYQMNFNSSVAAILSPGYRLRTTRNTAAPNQTALLNGTNQNFTRAAGSVVGFAFTNNFVVAVKAKGGAGQTGGLLARADATNGFAIWILPSGQVEFFATNGGSANYMYIRTIASVHHSQWHDIVGQMDMTNTTNDATNNYIMIDGQNYPCTVVRGGTNPTSFVQAGNLEIGTYRGANWYGGKISQAAVFSAKQSQATMRNYMSQGFLGTEPNLVSAYSLSNSVNDLNTTNANNLTANGGATTTTADAPWGQQADGTISTTLDYAIVQSVSGSSAIVQVPEGCTIPTVGSISAVAYSTVRSPYQMPVAAGRWDLYADQYSDYTVGTTVGTIGNHSGVRLDVPIGAWLLDHEGHFEASSNVSNSLTFTIGIDTANNALSNPQLVSRFYEQTSMSYRGVNYSRQGYFVQQAAMTSWYLNTWFEGGAGVLSWRFNAGSNGRTTNMIRARNAYL